MRFAWILMGCLAIAGCGGKDKDKAASKDKEPPKKEDAHNHEEGPHGGHLIELGEEEGHAEWLHDDDSGTVTIYVLDTDNKPIQIAADDVTIETDLAGEKSAVKLAAVRQKDATKTEKFQVVDKAFLERLKLAGAGVDAHIHIDVNGKVLKGEFEKHEH